MELTPLDAAHAVMTAAPGTDALRLRFYERLAESELFVLLAEESIEGRITPRVFDLDDGPLVLVFDREERLSAFFGGAAPYAALSGRTIAGLLAAEGMGLMVNAGTGAEFAMPPDAVRWLAQTLGNAPQKVEARPDSVHPPHGLPPPLLAALDLKLALAAGLARSAYLVGVVYTGNRRTHMMAFLGTRPGAEQALARAVAEALTFSGVEAGELDVGFFGDADPFAAQLARHGLRIDLPEAAQHEPAVSEAPGSDPDRPPILR